MKISKLLLLGMLAVALGMVSSAYAPPPCAVNLSDSAFPTGGVYNVGDTIEYELCVSVPAGATNCTLTDVCVYFYPPGSPPSDDACDDPVGEGILLGCVDVLAPGDPEECFTFDYVIEDVECDLAEPSLIAFMATTFVGPAGPDCDRKTVINFVNPVETPVCEIDGPSEICDTATGVVYCSIFPADSYSWVVTGDGVIDGLDNLPCVTVNPTGPSGFNVQLTVCTDNGTPEGCCSTCDVDVTVVSEPECEIDGPDVVCEDDDDVEYISLFPADSYSWVVTGDGVIDGPDNGPSVLVDPTGPGGYIVQLEVCNGAAQECCSRCELGVQVVEPPDCTVVGPESVCEDADEISYCSAAPADSYFWTVSGDGVIVGPDNESCVLVSPTGTGSYTVELEVCFDNPLCCDSCELPVDVVEVPDCLINDGPDTVCEDTAGIEYCSTAVADSYSWDISGNGVIVGPTDQQCVTVDAGAEGSFTLTLVVCNDSDIGPCCDDCEKTVTVEPCGVFCGFTQGFYGNAGGKACDGTKTKDLIEDLLAAGGPVVVGGSGRSITLNDADCIIKRLPAGGTPMALPAIGDFDDDCTGSDNKVLYKYQLLNKQKRYNNVLIGQVVALTLNLRLYDYDCTEDIGDLAGWTLPAEFCTMGEDGCPRKHTIPASLVGLGLTVADLLALANEALAGVDNGAPIGDINDAVTAVNEAFDECAEVIDCPTEEICDNGCDDDFDGLVDAADPDCQF